MEQNRDLNNVIQIQNIDGEKKTLKKRKQTRANVLKRNECVSRMLLERVLFRFR